MARQPLRWPRMHMTDQHTLVQGFFELCINFPDRGVSFPDRRVPRFANPKSPSSRIPELGKPMTRSGGTDPLSTHHQTAAAEPPLRGAGATIADPA